MSGACGDFSQRKAVVNYAGAAAERRLVFGDALDNATQLDELHLRR